MIQANELRIGNWYDHNGEYKQVTPNVIVDVWVYERVWCKPIPLTAEVLLKSGFEDNSYAVFSKRFNGNEYISISFKDYTLTKMQDHPVEVNDYSLDIECKYLHTLQNLWYALTSQELKINF